MLEFLGFMVVMLVISVVIQVLRNPKKTITYNDHCIEVAYGVPEQIRYDGRVVSEKTSMLGATHIFSTTERGEEVEYDAEIRSGFWGAIIVVRRNGKIIYSDK